jgi:hypothetical protein
MSFVPFLSAPNRRTELTDSHHVTISKLTEAYRRVFLHYPLAPELNCNRHVTLQLNPFFNSFSSFNNTQRRTLTCSPKMSNLAKRHGKKGVTAMTVSLNSSERVIRA